MTFKESLQVDIDKVFLNTDEFSEMHVVNGKEMPAMIDDYELIERKKRVNSNMDGIYAKEKLIYVPATEFGALPKQGTLLMLDGKSYRVERAVSEAGVYSITIGANKGR